MIRFFSNYSYRYLTEEKFKAPVIVYNYPKAIKAFYMKVNEDNKTVAAMDVLVPKVGLSFPLSDNSCQKFFRNMTLYMPVRWENLLVEAKEKRITRFSRKGKRSFVILIWYLAH